MERGLPHAGDAGFVHSGRDRCDPLYSPGARRTACSFFSAGKAAVKQMELPIKNTDFDMGKYNVVIAGSPTWAGNPSPFMKSFLDKAKNIQGKKFAVFSTGMSPLHEREQFKKIMKNYLEKADIKIFDSFLALQFRRGKLVDGVQNIDTFVNQLLKNENE